MSNKDLLDNIKKLREMTGVGFKDCKIALDETKGDLELFCINISLLLCAKSVSDILSFFF